MEPVTLQLKWPKDLYDLRLKYEDKVILEERIKSLYKGLVPQGPTNHPYSYHQRDETCPRKLFVTHQYCFVVLNSHNGMPYFDKRGLQQSKIKYIWECREGCFWLKKRLFSQKQFECLFILNHLGDVGYPQIELDATKEDKGQYRYFEKKAPSTLPEWLKEHCRSLSLRSLIGCIDAVKKIHNLQYQPASFLLYDAGTTGHLSMPHTLFHGDISPNNFICERSASGEIKVMLTDFHSIGDLKHIYWTTGWISPETVQYSITKDKYQDLDTRQFLKEYGAKKDTWALGLLIGSLLRGKFHPKYEQSLPCFSFITDKLKFDATGQGVIDQSGIAKITQEEIDAKIDKIINRTRIDDIREIWLCVKAYLRVDPNERPTVYERHLILSS